MCLAAVYSFLRMRVKHLVATSSNVAASAKILPQGSSRSQTMGYHLHVSTAIILNILHDTVCPSKQLEPNTLYLTSSVIASVRR
jgi:hypothetical protein